MKIRQAVQGDGQALLDLFLRLDNESSFMMLEPGERLTTAAQVEEMLAAFDRDGHSAVLVAEDETAGIVGHLTVEGGPYSRIRHSAYVVAGVRGDFGGRGIGGLLFTALEEWRDRTSVSRLELTVMVHNERALKLYRRHGFEIEGVKKKSLLVDGHYVDEYYMAKIC